MSWSDFRESLLISHSCRPKLTLRGSAAHRPRPTRPAGAEAGGAAAARAAVGPPRPCSQDAAAQCDAQRCRAERLRQHQAELARRAAAAAEDRPRMLMAAHSYSYMPPRLRHARYTTQDYVGAARDSRCALKTRQGRGWHPEGAFCHRPDPAARSRERHPCQPAMPVILAEGICDTAK